MKNAPPLHPQSGRSRGRDLACRRLAEKAPALNFCTLVPASLFFGDASQIGLRLRLTGRHLAEHMYRSTLTPRRQ
jgi:hypothetical protein